MKKNKQPIKSIKKYLGEIILIIGIGVFFYNIFNFSYTISIKGTFLSLFGLSDKDKG